MTCPHEWNQFLSLGLPCQWLAPIDWRKLRLRKRIGAARLGGRGRRPSQLCGRTVLKALPPTVDQHLGLEEGVEDLAVKFLVRSPCHGVPPGNRGEPGSIREAIHAVKGGVGGRSQSRTVRRLHKCRLPN